MSRTTVKKFENEAFIYQWSDISEDNDCVMRAYCLNIKDETVCVNIRNFTPYCYIELPSSINWQSDQVRLAAITNKLNENMGKSIVSMKLVYKKKLYYNHYHKSDDGWKDKKFPFLLTVMTSKKRMRNLEFTVRKPVKIMGQNFQLKMHEHNATSILQFVCNRNIKTSGWISFKGEEVEENDKETYAKYEYNVNHKDIAYLEKNIIPNPTVMSFDIEVNSTNPKAMPQSHIPGDEVFQISAVVKKQNSEKIDKYLITTGNPCHKTTGEDIELWLCGNEGEVLTSFATLVRETNPHIITGYNIFTFDIPYMIDRAKRCNAMCDFDQQGINIGHSPLKEIKWSSSAYGDQQFKFLDAQGRLYVDLLPLVKRDYKFDNYRLKTISTHFLGETKDPLSPKGIFKCYRLGMKAFEEQEKKDENQEYNQNIIDYGNKALGVVSKYCIVDSILVLKLFDIMNAWIGLVEMAGVTNVPIPVLYMNGQQIKVFSQMYKMCLDSGHVVEKDGYIAKDSEKYTGAYVFQPKPGCYDNVIPFDFSSLYPSTYISYNICYSTLVKDESIPDSMCNVIEWADHQGCDCDTTVRKVKIKKEDIYCAKHKYRFLKEEVAGCKGVVPTLLENLLEARKNTRKEQKNIKSDIEKFKERKRQGEKLSKKDEADMFALQTYWDVLEKRQLAYKISANSVYGATGASKGYLPFMPLAMSCTAYGRMNIKKAAVYLQTECGGDLIYGDTDSTYIRFPEYDNKPPQELWDHCLKMSDKVSAIFPGILRMEFEDVVYKRFLIFSKKRYVCLKQDREGNIDDKLGIRGILLQRRDNSNVVRNLYKQLIMDVFYGKDKEEVLQTITDELNKMFMNQVDIKDFVVTKSVKEISDYKVRPLPNDEKKRKEKLIELGCENEDEYAERALPAQAQLALKMRKRGKMVSSGERLEFVITKPMNPTDKLFDKIEDVEYQKEYADIIKIDPLYYAKMMTVPFNEVIEVGYGIEDHMTKEYKYRLLKWKCHRELEDLFKPCVVIRE